MQRGHCCLCRLEAWLHPPIKDDEDAIRAHDRSRRLAKSLFDAVARLKRGAAQHLAAGNFVLQRQSPPRAEVLFVGKLAHNCASLQDNFLSHDFAQAVNGSYVHPAEALQMLVDGIPLGPFLL